jgi:hypothetical protein
LAHGVGETAVTGVRLCSLFEELVDEVGTAVLRREGQGTVPAILSDMSDDIGSMIDQPIGDVIVIEGVRDGEDIPTIAIGDINGSALLDRVLDRSEVAAGGGLERLHLPCLRHKEDRLAWLRP